MTTAKQKFELLKAHHEAGHAVIARRLGIGVRRVCLSPTNDNPNGPHALTERAAHKVLDADVATQIAAIESDIKVCFAGMHAQCRYGDVRHPSEIREAWQDDIDNASSFVGMILAVKSGATLTADNVYIYTPTLADRTEADQLFASLRDETETLVDANWPAIERVAKALFKCRELTGDELDDLIAGRRIDLTPRKTTATV